MKKTFILGLLASMPVLAQQEAPTTKDLPVPPQGATQAHHWGARGEMPQPNARKDFHKKMLEKFDTDKDGQLNDAEKDAMEAEMQKRRAEDNNRPGVRGDRRPQGPHGDKKGRPGREDMHKKMLEKFDTDKDGQLNDAEKDAMKAEMQKRRAEGNNRPGVRGDRRPHGPHGDKKGRPGREDMHKKMLEKFDTDKDGQLSDAEKEAIKAQMPKRPEGKRGARHNNGANRPATLEL